jgi:hypothetical protein
VNECKPLLAGRMYAHLLRAAFDPLEEGVLADEAGIDGKCSPRHPTRFDPSLIELYGVL